MNKPKTFCIGQRFSNCYGDIFLLSQIKRNVIMLIDVVNGNRWSDREVIVNDPINISKKEFDRVCNGTNFELCL